MYKNTRDVAKELRVLADFLDSRPAFETEYYSADTMSFYDKNKFVLAAKALGDATKKVTEGEYAQFNLTSKHVPLTLTIQRDQVCRKEIRYECEPLFTPEEVQNL